MHANAGVANPSNACLSFCHCQFLFEPTSTFLRTYIRGYSAENVAIEPPESVLHSNISNSYRELPNPVSRVLQPGICLYPTLVIILFPAIPRFETRTWPTNARSCGWDEILYLPEYLTSSPHPLKPSVGPQHRPWSPILPPRRTGKQTADQGLGVDMARRKEHQAHRGKMAGRGKTRQSRTRDSRTT
jgi:hypothetical protein